MGLDIVLGIGATLRLSRLLTTDALGEWMIGRPARKWANRRERFAHHLGEVDAVLLEDDVEPENGPRSKLVSGLGCPFCCGYWLGVGVLGSYLVLRRSPATLRAWRFATATLAGNYLVGHIAARMD